MTAWAGLTVLSIYTTDCMYLLQRLMVIYTNSSVRLDLVKTWLSSEILGYDWRMLKEYDADICFTSLDILESNMLIFKFFICSHGP